MRVKCGALPAPYLMRGVIAEVFFNYLSPIINGKYVQSMEENLKKSKIS